MGSNIEIRPQRLYIGFVANTNFVDVHIQKSQIKLWLNLKKGELDDPKRLARDVSNVGHWGNGDYEVTVTPDSDLDLYHDFDQASVQEAFQVTGGPTL